MKNDKEILEALAEAYHDAIMGDIGDNGGSEPLGSEAGAVMILEVLRDLGFDVVRIPDEVIQAQIDEDVARRE